MEIVQTRSKTGAFKTLADEATARQPVEIERKKEYYFKVAMIGQYIYERSASYDEHIKMTERISSTIANGTNPFCCKIPGNGALQLEAHYGVPLKFHTPLGELSFNAKAFPAENVQNENARKIFMAELTNTFGLVEVSHRKILGNDRESGPIYALTKGLDGNPLPLPILPRQTIDPGYKADKAEWQLVRPDLEAVKAAVRPYLEQAAKAAAPALDVVGDNEPCVKVRKFRR